MHGLISANLAMVQQDPLGNNESFPCGMARTLALIKVVLPRRQINPHPEFAVLNL